MKLISKLLILFFALSLVSCHKNDSIYNINQKNDKLIVEQFTKVPNGLNPLFQKIANKLKEKEEQNSFLVKLGKKVGFPLWDKAQFNSRHDNVAAKDSSSGEEQTVIVPLSIPNSSEVNGFIAASINANNQVDSVGEFDKFSYYIFGFNKSNSEIDAEDIAIQCLILQKEIFNISSFKILDSRLFQDQDNSTIAKRIFEISLSESQQNSQLNSKPVIIKSNHCTHHDGYGPNGNDDDPDCDQCDWCGKFNYTILFFDSPFDWGGGGNFGEGGGNNGGGWAPIVPISLSINNIWQNMGLLKHQLLFVNNAANQDIVNKLALLMSYENFSTESQKATKVTLDAIIKNVINGPYTHQAFINIIDNLSILAVEGGSTAYWEYFNYLKNSFSNNTTLTSEDLFWKSTYECNKIFNYFYNLRLTDPECQTLYNNYLYTYQGYTTGHHWWMNEDWLDNPSNFNLDIDPKNNNQYDKLTAAEKALVKANPRAAMIIKSNKSIVEQQTIIIMGNNGLNDKSDAFRHAFFQSLNTVRIGASLTQQFSDAHETETPIQLIKEKQMDLFNNSIGIAHGQAVSSTMWTVNIIANDIYTKVLNGELKYLSPIWSAKFNTSGQLINPAGDPNFYGTNGTYNPATATHGITASTLLIPTNQ
ncbi:MAG: hypothetical protein IT237_01695 [Bacteroidia bacterium]|nr:hypothetical protein [Bacteroidia bacterium]